jgi:hypothetical protein
MTPEECAAAVAEPVGHFGTVWMMEPATFALGGEHGFGIFDFYFCGRAGVVEGIDAAGAHQAMAIFPFEIVEVNWAAGIARQPLADTAQLWWDACAQAGRRHLPDDAASARIAELAGKVAAAADATDKPIFAAWRDQPAPDDAPAAAAFHLNSLRELRGAAHVNALEAEGIPALEALVYKSGPEFAMMFGHQPPLPEVTEELKARWEVAEEATNAEMAPAFAALDEDEREELVELLATTLD